VPGLELAVVFPNLTHLEGFWCTNIPSDCTHQGTELSHLRMKSLVDFVEIPGVIALKR